MNFEFIHQPYFLKIVQSVCWTLVHSLWQGLLLAGVTGLILLTTRKSSPALRYNLLSLSLLMFVLTSIFTFLIVWEYTGFSSQTQHYVIDFVSQQPGSAGGKVTEAYFLINQEKYASLLIGFLTDNAVFIVACWFAIFISKTIKAATGLIYIQRISRFQVQAPSVYWKQKIESLAGKLNINQEVALVESRIADVPMVVGFLKPLILVPAGLLTSLPLNQVEAILLHELAHVKRRDYLVNLLQSFGENLFFFNPGVLWISALIKSEREHCCDDMAIAATKNRTSFIDALVTFQEYKLSCSGQATAFAGKKNHLLDRIKRIIYKNNKPLNAMEKLFVTASLIAATLLSLAISAPSQKPESSKTTLKLAVDGESQTLSEITEDQVPIYSVLEPVSKDTLPAYELRNEGDGLNTYRVITGGVNYSLVEQKGKILLLMVDGKKIADDQIASYQPTIDKLMQEIKVARQNAEMARIEADKQRGEADELRREADVLRIQADKVRDEADQRRESTEKYRLQADDLRKQGDNLSIQGDRLRQQGDKQKAEAEKLQLFAKGNRMGADEVRRLSDLTKIDANAMKIEAEKLRLGAEDLREHALVLRKEAEKSKIAFEKFAKDFTNDLLTDGLIKSTDDMSYKLTNQELIVNGVKQPDQVHQKYKMKYVKEAGWEAMYNYNGKIGVRMSE